ncbi:hypothetical protein FEK35_16850 [Nocardia cyriacigeorgica]|uniref:Uncharacterized protein n=1 Tax=Nocardia cyriacigeorgica TaxID=135487 RepID=A0A5R8PC42_9NOCA|nr:hypothetical protein FEK35_16850 [Nocardia cyriacigeorgica]
MAVLEAGPEPVGSWPRHYDSLTLISPATYNARKGLASRPDQRHPHRAGSPSRPTATGEGGGSVRPRHGTTGPARRDGEAMIDREDRSASGPRG